MYLSHFNLKIKPFRISPDPKFLWLGQTHKEALSMLKYGIHDDCGFLLLSGDIGTGKTTLINGLLDSLDDQTLTAMIADPGLEKLDFYNFITQAFDIKKTFKSKGDFLVYFIHFLHKANADGKKVLIIIDEAQRLSHEIMEEIRQLSNIEKKDAKLLNIFLVGQHELIDTLNETRNRALLQRITMKYLIGPLKHEDVGNYIAFRLKVAGTEKKIFSGAAIRQIISFSKGYPRLINIICDHALLTAYVKGKQKVDGAIIKECAKDLQINVEPPKGSQKNIRFSDRLMDAFWHLSKKPLSSILLFLGLLILTITAAGILLFKSGFMPSLITDLFPAKPSQHLEIALDNAKSAPKPSVGSSAAPDSVAQLADTNLVSEKTVSASKTSGESSAAPDSIAQPADTILVLEKTVSAPKTSGESSTAPDSIAQPADTNLVLEKTVSAPKTSGESSSTPDSIAQPAGMTPKPETGSPETITPPPPAESVQTAPPFQEKMFTVQFPSDSNEFSPEAYALLDDMIDLALRYDGLEILITGYTDSVGNKDYNRQLSKFRATVVKIYIVGKGVDSKRLFASGRGPDNPIAPNNTPEGRQLNRRVEIKLQSKQ